MKESLACLRRSLRRVLVVNLLVVVENLVADLLHHRRGEVRHVHVPPLLVATRAALPVDKGLHAVHLDGEVHECDCNDLNGKCNRSDYTLLPDDDENTHLGLPQQAQRCGLTVVDERPCGLHESRLLLLVQLERLCVLQQKRVRVLHVKVEAQRLQQLLLDCENFFLNMVVVNNREWTA